MTPALEKLRADAHAAGWGATPRHVNGGDAFELGKLGEPDIRFLVVDMPSQRHGFAARLSVCRRERAMLYDPADVLALLQAPEKIGPRCSKRGCSRCTREEGQPCLQHAEDQS